MYLIPVITIVIIILIIIVTITYILLIRINYCTSTLQVKLQSYYVGKELSAVYLAHIHTIRQCIHLHTCCVSIAVFFKAEIPQFFV